MSICTGVIVAVAFQQVDDAPDAESGTQCHDESLQCIDCAVEKCHKFFPPLPSPSRGTLGPTEMKDAYIKSPPQDCMCTCSPGKDRKIAGTDDQSVPAMYSSNVGVRERMESFGEQDFLALFKARVVSLLF